MKKYVILIVSMILSFLVGCLVTTYILKITKIEGGLVTVETVFGQEFNYYWESEE